MIRIDELSERPRSIRPRRRRGAAQLTDRIDEEDADEVFNLQRPETCILGSLTTRAGLKVTNGGTGRLVHDAELNETGEAEDRTTNMF